MRVLHAADFRLDACYADTGFGSVFGNRRRQALRDVFHDLVTRAAEWPADAVLLAGNLFTASRVNRDTVVFVQDELDRIRPIPVFITPGPLDPFSALSPYAGSLWPPHVNVFETPDWKPVILREPGLAVYGLAWTEATPPESDPFVRLSPLTRSSMRHIALAYGPIPSEPARNRLQGLQYIALGCGNNALDFTTHDAPAVYSSGAPEPHGFEEDGFRHYLEVELDDNGLRVTPVMSSRVCFSTKTIDVTGLASPEEIASLIRNDAAGSPCPVVMRATLSGSWKGEQLLDMDAIRELAAPAFDALDLIDDTRMEENWDHLAETNTCLGHFTRRLNEELHDAPDAARARMVRRARMLGMAAFRNGLPATTHGGEE